MVLSLCSSSPDITRERTANFQQQRAEIEDDKVTMPSIDLFADCTWDQATL
jgi:hypothetical protein